MNWQDAFENQMSLWKWHRSDLGMRVLFRWAEAEITGDPWKKDFYQVILSNIVPILWRADPIFVSADMCDLIDTARESFQPEPFHPDDLLTTHGFINFEKPFHLRDRSGKSVSIGAVAFAPTITEDDKHGIVFLFFSSAFSEWDENAPHHQRMMREFGMPSLQLLTVQRTWFEMDFPEYPPDEFPDQQSASEWWVLTQVTLRLMQQHIAERHEHRPDRAARRRAQKAGFQHENPITVVRLRREVQESKNGDSEIVPWSHRWIVAGHWRNQFFPSTKTHRQIWIHAFVKGPEDKPLIVKRRAYNWVR